MLPAIARQAIAAYSQPGDRVLDPMCGIGTTLVEAIHLGRDAFGVELESRWANLASANIAHACRRGATGTATVVTGDARHLAHLVDPDLAGRVALVLTPPPMVGACTARSPPAPAVVWPSSTTPTRRPGQPRPGRPTDLPGCPRGDPGRLPAAAVSRGLLALTARPYRHRDQLVDLPGQLTQVAEAAGLVLYERNAALLVGLREDLLIPRPSFFQLDRVRKARARGLPLRIIAHEDVLVFRRPPTSVGSR